MINPILSYTEESQLKSRCKANTYPSVITDTSRHLSNIQPETEERWLEIKQLLPVA